MHMCMYVVCMHAGMSMHHLYMYVYMYVCMHVCKYVDVGVFEIEGRR